MVEFVAGAASGFVADGVTHPVDTVRTRLWVQGEGTAYRYSGLLHGTVDMVKKEGLPSLFKGFGSVALLTPLAHGLYFGSYEWFKRTLGHRKGGLGLGDSSNAMISGFFANGVGGLVWNPMDVVKQKQQANVGSLYKSPLNGLVEVWREGGMCRGLMKGYWSGMATYGPFSAIYFMMYENWKVACMKWTTQHARHDELNTGHYVAGGFIAGSAAAVATAPIDLIKTRIQVCDHYSGMYSTATRIIKEEGYGVFTKGLGARILWVAPGCAITIAVFEDIRKFCSSASDFGSDGYSSLDMSSVTDGSAFTV